VILQDAFTVEPWNLRETHLDLDLLAQAESVFALANGHVGWRANLDEGEPHGLPGSYLNGVWESRPLPYAESAYGLPETGQEVINVTNGKLIRLFVDDEPFDVRYGTLRGHERLLDFRAGVLNRRTEWVSPAGRRVRISSVRLVSFTQRAVAAICYEVEPLEAQARLAVQSELLTNEQLPRADVDPRVPAALEDPLSHEYSNATFWDRADVQVDGDAEVQQAVRFALFHVLQAGARAENRAIPAKGLTGPGYDGHAFWDTETFVLAMGSFIAPKAAASALRWRHSTLPLALDRARQLGLAGAAFPWRTIAGQECSGYWPAGTAAFHVNADIAIAAVRYVDATGDEDFARDTGMDLLVHTARLWRSLGHHDDQGRFHIDGVTGPDEYSALADDNVYTNLAARRNLLAAADAAKRYRERARELGVTGEEAAAWRDAAQAMTIPYDEALGVHPQAAGFTRHQPWDFARTSAEQYPLLLHFPYFDLYRKQVVKQADLVLAMQLNSSAFSGEQKARNFAYYEQLTVRDSSLSACTQAVVAAEVGHLDLAYDYLGEAALMDLRDLEHNTRDGIHIASLAGTWIALVSGFGGLRLEEGTFKFAPRLPEPLTRLAFTLFIRGRRLRVEITHAEASYTLADGDPLEIVHHGQPVRLSAGKPLARPIPSAPSRPRPSQPPGREPARRRSLGNGPQTAS
jgi:trehalose/maltose hydrolase-like predicted phosphorylase